MRTLLVATTNRGKVREMTAQLAGLGLELKSLGDLDPMPPGIEETGITFRENALLKADHYHAMTGFPTLSDDSGLEVAALGGRPGVFSARYGGVELSDEKRNELLLGELSGTPDGDRAAAFVCVLALVGTGIRQTFEGICRGTIAFEPRGAGGFGYDPIFLDPGTERSYAELSLIEKTERSHRGQAMARLRQYMMASTIID
ncbi:MAG: RdgB/HAM1 family non-canonical purine NTP pyrophosphatase [Blastocatellia bacterium]|jgi:XTP/dITP diphosphohydrolase